MEAQLNNNPASNTKNTLVKSAVLLMILTVVGKFFGFAREMTQAYFFGATVYTDAYLVAMTIPSVLFLSVSGAINNVFIPVYDNFRSQGRDKALFWKFTLTCIVLCFFVFIIPVLLNSSLAARIFAPEFSDEAIALAAGMLRILIFIIFFRLLTAVSTAVLHVNRNFLVPGLVGIPYSLTIMTFCALFAGSMGINALVWGTFVGVATRFLVIFPWLAKTKMGGAIGDKVSDGLKEIAILLPPVLMGSLAQEFKAMIDRIFASGLAEGSISFLNYAVRVNALPIGLLVGTVSIVLYPTLVAHFNNKQLPQYKSAVANALNVLTFVMLPITAGFAILALPIIQLIFMRGSFDAQAAEATAYALRFYSPFLLGAMLYNLMLKAFYAIKDTKTPFVAMLISVMLNILLNMVLIGPLTHGGLALATAISSLTAATFMYFRLGRIIGPLLNKHTLADLGKSVVATIVMAVVCLAAYYLLAPHIPQAFMGRMAYIGAIILLSATVYFTLAWIMKISAMHEGIAIIIKVKNKYIPNKPS